MTESEWLACTDPQTMLAFVNGATLCRKLRLFHLASCREALSVTSDERLLRAVLRRAHNRDVDGIARLEIVLRPERRLLNNVSARNPDLSG